LPCRIPGVKEGVLLWKGTKEEASFAAGFGSKEEGAELLPSGEEILHRKTAKALRSPKLFNLCKAPPGALRGGRKELSRLVTACFQEGQQSPSPSANRAVVARRLEEASRTGKIFGAPAPSDKLKRHFLEASLFPEPSGQKGKPRPLAHSAVPRAQDRPAALLRRNELRGLMTKEDGDRLRSYETLL
jgi:hypothetical protein